MFFCKDIFGNIPKSFPVKEIQAIPDTFSFFGNRHSSVPSSGSFLIASRFTPHALRVFPPCLISAMSG